MKLLFSIVLFTLIFSAVNTSAAVISVTDDEGREVILPDVSKKIVSLSPHATELLFAAGATKQIVATVNYSDFPEQAKSIPRIGTYKKIDLESIIKINPDLIIAWKSGGSHEQINQLERLGYKLYFSEPGDFKGVAENIVNMGLILGTSHIANKAAQQFMDELELLKKKYNSSSQIDVFYQVWNNPLMTINKGHLITNVIEFCGGHNVFSHLISRAPRVNIEAIFGMDPDAIIIGMSENRKDWVDPWYQWGGLKAVKNKHIFTVNADYIVRQGPRILKGIESVCESLDEVRRSKKAVKP